METQDSLLQRTIGMTPGPSQPCLQRGEAGLIIHKPAHIPSLRGQEKVPQHNSHERAGKI
jgi:hypothetical protein